MYKCKTEKVNHHGGDIPDGIPPAQKVGVFLLVRSQDTIHISQWMFRIVTAHFGHYFSSIEAIEICRHSFLKDDSGKNVTLMENLDTLASRGFLMVRYILN